MPIRMIYLSNEYDILGMQGVHGPCIICDYCGQAINDLRSGLYIYGVSFEHQEQATGPKFFHKSYVNPACGESQKRYEKALRDSGYYPGWDELAHFIEYLTNNVKEPTR